MYNVQCEICIVHLYVCVCLSMYLCECVRVCMYACNCACDYVLMCKYVCLYPYNMYGYICMFRTYPVWDHSFDFYC